MNISSDINEAVDFVIECKKLCEKFLNDEFLENEFHGIMTNYVYYWIKKHERCPANDYHEDDTPRLREPDGPL